jgi:ATP-dependent RNA helicase RhlE
MGFIQPVRRIAAATPAASRQTMLFSATLSGPILQLAQSLLRDPVRVSVTPAPAAAPKIEQHVFMIDRHSKQSLLQALLSDTAAGDVRVARALVFTRTKHGADRVGRNLAQAGIIAETIHGNKSQPQRRRALDRFSGGRARVLVATDVAARGLDVDRISHVVNFDLPVEPEAYIHRIGRTGRAGASGIALSFCDREERALLRDIERLLGHPIPVRSADGMVAPNSGAARQAHQVAAHPAAGAHTATKPHRGQRAAPSRGEGNWSGQGSRHRAWHKPTKGGARR